MASPVATAGRPPAVVTWFRIYAGLLALLYLGVVGIGCALPAIVERDPSVSAEDLALMQVVSYVYMALGVVLCGVFVAGLVLKPRPWVWIYDLVLICIGFMSCCTLPASIALLIYWLKPEAKAWFGRA